VIRTSGPRGLRLAGVFLAGVVAAWSVPSPPSSAASQAPTLAVTPAAAPVGKTVVVEGRGFPSQTYDVQVQVCGNLGLNGTADCDPAGVRTSFAVAGGFALNLPVTMPPKPCPCAIVAFSSVLSDVVEVPFSVIGAPEAAPAPAPPAFEQKTLRLENAKLEGNGGWQSWFGASTTRDLVFTVYNAGTAPVDDPPLVLTAGTGHDPEGVVTPPRVGRLEPGARRTVHATIPIETLSVGSYTVKGRIGNSGADETFRARTSTYPWGLLVLAILMLLVVVLWIRNALRRLAARRAGKRAARSTEPADVDDDSVDDEEWTTDDQWAEDGEWADDEDAATEVHWRPITRPSARVDESEKHSFFGRR
jgi:hypothetical protein